MRVTIIATGFDEKANARPDAQQPVDAAAASAEEGAAPSPSRGSLFEDRAPETERDDSYQARHRYEPHRSGLFTGGESESSYERRGREERGGDDFDVDVPDFLR